LNSGFDVRLDSHLILLSKGAINFFTQVTEDLACTSGDVDVFEMTRAGQINLVFPFHAPGAEGEQGNSIPEAHSLTNVVRDEDDGAPGLCPKALEFVVKQVASLRVKRREGFVHEKNIGLGGKGAGQRYALAHSA
jgi:hypothetical protein